MSSSSRFVSGVAGPAVAVARQYVIVGQSLHVTGDGQGVAVPRGSVDDGRWLYLGALDGEPCFACAVDEGEAGLDGSKAISLRQLFGVLEDVDFAVAMRALGVTTWDRDHRHCGRCGGTTERSASERARVCARCGLSVYPRMSPAIIVLVEREGRALLALGAGPGRFHSCLAGFVELGETLEEAVAREVAEEVGIEIREVRYFGSQSWPFSTSMMIGFTAEWAGGELRPDGVEILEAGWYEPGGMPRLGSRISISRALIDDFCRRHSPSSIVDRGGSKG